MLTDRLRRARILLLSPRFETGQCSISCLYKIVHVRRCGGLLSLREQTACAILNVSIRRVEYASCAHLWRKRKRSHDQTPKLCATSSSSSPPCFASSSQWKTGT